MNWDEMNTAVKEAEAKLSLLDSFAEKLARLLVGRLRKIDNRRTLHALKAELRDYNARTGRWS